MIPIVLLPDLSNLIADNTLAWTAYLTLSQISMAALAMLAIRAPRTYPWRVTMVAAFLWYLTQALDEALAGNLFSNAALEYVVFSLYVAAITIHLRTHE